jgi:hypothetical protein
MPETKVVLLEQDDLMHPNTGESNFNESAYYNFYDHGQRLGGFIRLGNRANEGYAEMTACSTCPMESSALRSSGPRSRTTTHTTRAV